MADKVFGQLTLSRGENLEKHTQRAGLQLRERRLRREGLELESLMSDPSLDPEVSAVLSTINRENSVQVFKLQQSLTTRTIGRVTDPWGRS
jgi:hypothetical protein